ncbi:unnamed protein product [Alopecurus aequalis]
MAAQEGAAGTTPTHQVMKVRYGDVDDSNFKLPVPLILGLAAAVVGFVALCLYLRWLCCRRREREASSSAAATASPVPHGLDADAINGLPVTLYSPARSSAEEKGVDDEREAECSICITALVAGDKVKALPPCGHCFHPDCVDAWLRSQPSCPLCRTLLLAAGAKPVDAVNGSEHDDSPV